MKKVTLAIFTAMLMLFSIPTLVFADSSTATPKNMSATVEIPVKSNVDTAEIIIAGDQKLPEQTVITGEGVFKMDFSDTLPGDVFKYTISQKLDNKAYTVDTTVYNVTVTMFTEENTLYAVTVIDQGTEVKPDKCTFNNVPIPVPPEKPTQPTPPNVQTGDNNNMWIWIGVLGGVVVIGAIVTVVLTRKKKKED